MWISTQQVNTDLIFCICQILGKKWEYKVEVYKVLIDFKKLMIQLGGKSEMMFSLSLLTHETGKVNKNESD
jgi:hypothetical protein